MRKITVWGRLVKLVKWEGAATRVVVMFFMAVAQEVLLFVLETWVLLTAMERKEEGTHTGF